MKGRPTAAGALQAAVSAICATIGWPAAHLLWREEAGTGLVSSGVWHLDPPRPAFREALEGRRGPGLVGDVLRTAKPVWIADLRVATDREGQSAALEAGLQCAVALPIITSQRVVGVLELFHDRPVAHDAQLLRQLGEVLSLLGAILERDLAQRREQFLASVVEDVAHPIFVKDREFRFVLLNKALCEMVGHSREEMLGKTDYDFFSKAEADFFREKDVEMFRSGSPVVIDEEPITDSAGNLHVLATTKVPLLGPSGEVTHLAGIIHDITRLRAAEERGRQVAEAREAVRVRDEFLSIASHELRTPLTTLRLQGARLLALAEPGSAQARGLATMQRQVDQLTVLINNLLDVTRVAAGRLELSLSRIELGGTVREVVERLSVETDQAGSSVRVIAPVPVSGRWDRLRVEQVVTNLLSNALKYGAGKPIEITVEPTPSGGRVAVRDFGIGIAEADLGRIFERFERVGATHRYAGLGLGLHISRQIVLAHGGTITVRSRPGEGSTFTVELPAEPPGQVRAPGS
ncbi:MAG: sensor histidine kinase [Myxococcaceae bacterium]